jgi:hypothetical protein
LCGSFDPVFEPTSPLLQESFCRFITASEKLGPAIYDAAEHSVSAQASRSARYHAEAAHAEALIYALSREMARSALAVAQQGPEWTVREIIAKGRARLAKQRAGELLEAAPGDVLGMLLTGTYGWLQGEELQYHFREEVVHQILVACEDLTRQSDGEVSLGYACGRGHVTNS